MGNTLKMDRIELLNRLFKQGWSIRKINRSTGIHRSTISSYHRRWLKAARHQKSKSEHKNFIGHGDPGQVQSVPLKCPPGGVVHFEVPTAGTV